MSRLLAFLCAGLLLALTATAQALPPAVEADRLALQAKAALDARDFSTADEALSRMEALGVALPDQFFYLRGIAANGVGKYKRALKYLDSYLQRTGNKGKYYQQALTAYTAAETGVKQAQADYQAAMARYNEEVAAKESDRDDCVETRNAWGQEIRAAQAEHRWDDRDRLWREEPPSESKCNREMRENLPAQPAEPNLD